MIVLLIIILLTLIETVSLQQIKLYSLTLLPAHYVASIAGYSLIMYMLSFILRNKSIGLINYGWNIVSTIFVFIMGYFSFSEILLSSQVAGVILATAGLSLIL